MRSHVTGVLFACLLATTAFAQSSVIAFNSVGSAVNENVGTVDIHVFRTGSLTGTSKVDYATTGGAGAAAGYYVATSGTLTFHNGEDDKIITITVLDDAVAGEPSQTLELLLSNWVNASADNNHYAYYLEIKDDEAPPPPLTLSYGSLTFSEGDGVTNTYLTVNLNRASDKEIWIGGFRPYTPPNADQYNNARVTLGDLRFEPGETTKQVAMTITGNDTYESVTKTFHFQPSYGGLEPLVATEFNITLTEDDAMPAVSITDLSVPEGSCGPTPIEITLTANAPANGLVYWSASDGTATQAGIDWGPYGVPEPARFINSTTAKITVVAPYGDLDIEDDETFSVTLTGATNMSIADDTATVTIENDDEELPSFAQELVRVEAGDRSQLSIRFPAPAPGGSILLSSSDPRVTVPASIEVPERATSVSFNADASAAAGRVVITAQLPGQLGKAQLHATVDAVKDTDLRFEMPRRTAFAGETSIVSLALDPPSQNNVTVELRASAGIIAPESVVVPAGASVNFAITALAAGTGWIHAVHGDQSTSIDVEVVPQQLMAFAPDFAPTTGGLDITLTGAGFSPGCAASFGHVAAQTTFVDAQTLIARAPTHAAQNVRITVTCGVTPVLSTNEFRFANVRRRSSQH
jgi:hypothetical protein